MINLILFILCGLSLLVWTKVNEHAKNAVIISLLTVIGFTALNNTIHKLHGFCDTVQKVELNNNNTNNNNNTK